MADPSFNALLIKNIGKLDKTMKFINELQNQIFTAISEYLEKWSAQHGWLGEFKFSDEDFDIWLGKPEWKPGDAASDTDSDFWFSFYVDSDDPDTGIDPFDYFYVTRLCGAGHGRFCFSFRQHVCSHGRFKKLCMQHSDKFLETPFYLDSKGFYSLHVQIDPEKLAQAAEEEDFALAFSAIDVAMQTIVQNMKLFDDLAAAAKTLTTR